MNIHKTAERTRQARDARVMEWLKEWHVTTLLMSPVKYQPERLTAEGFDKGPIFDTAYEAVEWIKAL